MKPLNPKKYNELLAESLKGIGFYLLTHKIKLMFRGKPAIKDKPKCVICDSTDLWDDKFCYDCAKEHYS